MKSQDFSIRQKSQRVLQRMRNQKKLNYYHQFKQEARSIGNIQELLPGLNDISDAFEAMPMELIKYFTLLKEIDAKYISMVPLINHRIKNYIERLHKEDEEVMSKGTEVKKLTFIRDKLSEIVSCLEEKMHVTTITTDLVQKHLFRINSDYKFIIANNEIPESVRIGPLNHPAMIMESNPGENSGKGSAQVLRSGSRREALAAKKASKENQADDSDEAKKKRLNGSKEIVHNSNETGSVASLTSNSRKRKNEGSETPLSGTPGAQFNNNPKKKTTVRTKKEEKDFASPSEYVNTNPPSNSNEPTYCYCNQVSFGEMVGCDGEDCKREWFHLPCIGFKNPPKGKWYCDDCLLKMKKVK